MKDYSHYRKRIYPIYTRLHSVAAITPDRQIREANAAPFLSRISGWLTVNKDAACLDVGCGTGRLLYALRSAGYTNLSGVDCSLQQVSLARQACENVEQGDAIDYLRTHAGLFDLITAFDIIEHFAKDEVIMFLDELQRALKPGGRLIIQTPNADSPWFGSLRYGDFTHEIAFTPDSLACLLSVSGFKDFEAHECRPFFHGIKSGTRLLLWHVIRAGLLALNLVETGSAGSGIFTRVFIAKADKPS